MSPSSNLQPLPSSPKVPMSPLSPPALLPSPQIHCGDDELQDAMLENFISPHLSSFPMSPRVGGYPTHALPPISRSAGLVNGGPRRNRGYSESSTYSDSSSSSTGFLIRPPPSLRTQIINQHPAGPAGNPKLNNSALQGIWDIYRKEAGDYDAAMIESWHANIDNLILFAGLFSGIITTFLMESYKSLHPPRPNPLHPGDDGCAMFGCGPHAIRINTMWFASLALSLVSALIAMIAKQWIAGYKVELLFSGTGSSEWFHEACRLRQFRFDGLQKYKMAQVIAATPILLHTAIWCFCTGLVDFLWTVNHTVAIPVTALCGLTFFFYVGSTVSAVVSPRSPFKTALARLICGLRTGNIEQDHVKIQGEKLDKDVVEWLISTSRNQDIYNEAMKALLELKRAGRDVKNV